MVSIAAYYLVVLGVLHVLFGLVRFRTPLREALLEGFIGRFGQNDARRLAFWFIIVGPLLSLLGLGASHAFSCGDLELILTMGATLLVASVIGVLAFPASPLWGLMPPAFIFVLGGLGLVA